MNYYDFNYKSEFIFKIGGSKMIRKLLLENKYKIITIMIDNEIVYQGSYENVYLDLDYRYYINHTIKENEIIIEIK